MKFCTNCGCQMEDSSKFCTSCGTSFEPPVSKPVSDPVTAPAPSAKTSIFPVFTPEPKEEPAPASKNPFFAPVDPNWNTDDENSAPTVAFDPPRSTANPVPPAAGSAPTFGGSNPVPPAAGSAPTFGGSNPVPPAAGSAPMFGGSNPVPPTSYSNPYGTPISYGSGYGAATPYAKKSSSFGYTILVILAILSLLVALLVPPYCMPGELIPEFEDDLPVTHLGDYFELIGELGLDVLEFFPVLVVLSVTLFSVLLLIGAFVRSKVLSIVFSCLGLLPLLFIIIDTALLDSETFYLGSMLGSDSIISIGFWIPLVLFGISLIISIVTPSRKKN